MPFDALSAKASEIVPVGAIDSRWLLRMPSRRISDLSFSGRRAADGRAYVYSYRRVLGDLYVATGMR